MRQKRALSQLGQIFALTTLLMWLVHKMFTCCNKHSDPGQCGWLHVDWGERRTSAMWGKKGHQGLVAEKEPNDPKAPGPETAEMAKKRFQQGVGEPWHTLLSPLRLFQAMRRTTSGSVSATELWRTTSAGPTGTPWWACRPRAGRHQPSVGGKRFL